MTTFLTEPPPPYGEAVPVAPGVRRVVAPNPGPMTCHGTNTYLIDGPDGTTVLDPGPQDAGHTEAVLRATGGRVALILLTHTHPDHLGGVSALRAATGAPVAAWHAPAMPIGPGVALQDGEVVAGMTALHTPGHAADHLCFVGSAGVLFSGDHVMSWSSTVVIPPDGTMADYMRSLDRLLARTDTLFLPGHGPPLPDPLPFVGSLRDHRLRREGEILAALDTGSTTTTAITARVYDVAPSLRRAAERNVLAHLLKLEGEGQAARDGKSWRATPSATAGR